LARLVANLRRNGLLGTTQAARALLEDRVFDWRYGVDTSGKIATEQLAVESRHLSNAIDYEPTVARYFKVILRQLEVPDGSVFVDFGSGKGRALLLAAQSGRFKRVVGVEFSRHLCRIAQSNLCAFQHRYGTDAEFEIVTADAAGYQVRADQNVFFKYNPFDHVVIEQVLERIDFSLKEEPRPIWFIYHAFTPKYKIEDRQGYVKIHDLRYGNARAAIFVNTAAQY